MSTMTLTQSAAPTKVTARRPATVRRESNVRAAIMPLVSGLLLVLAVLVGVGVLSAAVAVILAGDSAVATTLVLAGCDGSGGDPADGTARPGPVPEEGSGPGRSPPVGLPRAHQAPPGPRRAQAAGWK